MCRENFTMKTNNPVRFESMYGGAGSVAQWSIYRENKTEVGTGFFIYFRESNLDKVKVIE